MRQARRPPELGSASQILIVRSCANNALRVRCRAGIRRRDGPSHGLVAFSNLARRYRFRTDVTSSLETSRQMFLYIYSVASYPLGIGNKKDSQKEPCTARICHAAHRERYISPADGTSPPKLNSSKSDDTSSPTTERCTLPRPARST